MICQKRHRFLNEFKQLSDSQDDQKSARHKCAGCAFLKGLQEALSGVQMAASLDAGIPDSQAGTVRHKDAYEAYKQGYQEGMKYMV